jgi:purine-binding chemotaxis protein CheW
VEQQLVIFELAEESFGLNIADVESIVKMQDITIVPHAPDFVQGVTNLRGTVLPVIDLRKRFGLPEVAFTPDTRIVVVDINGVKVGIIVDAVAEVLRVSDEEIEPPSPFVTTAASAFITGIAKIDSRLIILVDLVKILAVEEDQDL